MSSRKTLLAAVLLASLASGAMAADGGTVVEHTLPNGLKIVVWPDHDIPNVAQYTWYRAGGRNEYPGITGLAHYFEHMMFNGTSNLPPGEFDRRMEAAGGANNAYTSNDVTVYQNWFPVTALETVFTLEADRMANLDFDPDVVESERGVVYSERRTSVDNDNFGALMEQVQATAYLAHPYQFPVIGWPSDIENWSMQDLKDFYRTYYAPNNAVMFIVGDVQPEEIIARAEAHFAAIPAQEPPAPVTTVEPEQQGERRVVLERQAQAPLLTMAWHSPNAAHPDTRVLEVLVTVLTSGDSALLNQELVEKKQLAIQVGGYIHQGFDPGLTWLYAVLPPGGDPARVEAEIERLLARIATRGVTQGELQRAKSVLVADHYRRLATISGKAQMLGTYEVFHGDYRKLFDAPAAWEAVTAEQVRDVAAKIFRNSNRTVGVLRPVTGEQ